MSSVTHLIDKELRGSACSEHSFDGPHDEWDGLWDVSVQDDGLHGGVTCLSCRGSNLFARLMQRAHERLARDWGNIAGARERGEV